MKSLNNPLKGILEKKSLKEKTLKENIKGNYSLIQQIKFFKRNLKEKYKFIFK